MTFAEIPAAVWGAIAAAWLGMTGWFMKRHFAYGERLGIVETKIDDMRKALDDHVHAEDSKYATLIELIKEKM